MPSFAVPAVVLVALGGVAGALSRYLVQLALPHEPGRWSWSTLLVNAVGAAALVVLVAAGPSARARLLLGTGLLGGFTTFSTFTVDAVLLADAGRPGVATAYVAAGVLSLLAGAGAALLLTRGAAR